LFQTNGWYFYYFIMKRKITTSHLLVRSQVVFDSSLKIHFISDVYGWQVLLASELITFRSSSYPSHSTYGTWSTLFLILSLLKSRFPGKMLRKWSFVGLCCNSYGYFFWVTNNLMQSVHFFEKFKKFRRNNFFKCVEMKEDLNLTQSFEAQMSTIVEGSILVLFCSKDNYQIFLLWWLKLVHHSFHLYIL